MSLETVHIILTIIMIFAALYLICIGAFTCGMVLFRRNAPSYDQVPEKKVSVLIAARAGLRLLLQP